MNLDYSEMYGEFPSTQAILIFKKRSVWNTWTTNSKDYVHSCIININASKVQRWFVHKSFFLRRKYGKRDTRKVSVYENYASGRQAVPMTSIYIMTEPAFGNCEWYLAVKRSNVAPFFFFFLHLAEVRLVHLKGILMLFAFS